jgi:hypothetical protein
MDITTTPDCSPPGPLPPSVIARAVTAADSLADWYAGLCRAAAWGFTTFAMITMLGLLIGSSVPFGVTFLLGIMAGAVLGVVVFKARMVQRTAMEPTERETEVPHW